MRLQPKSQKTQRNNAHTLMQSKCGILLCFIFCFWIKGIIASPLLTLCFLCLRPFSKQCSSTYTTTVFADICQAVIVYRMKGNEGLQNQIQ